MWRVDISSSWVSFITAARLPLVHFHMFGEDFLGVRFEIRNLPFEFIIYKCTTR